MENKNENLQKMIRSDDYNRLIEVRTAKAEEGKEPEDRVIEGVPIVFGQKTELYRYKSWDGKEVIVNEIIESGALDNAETKNCFLKFNHEEGVMPVARVKNGTLKLDIKADCVEMRATLADTTAGRDLYTLVKDGTIDKMSFAFTIDEDGGSEIESVETDETVVVTRTVKKINALYDVAAVTVPAYDQTSLYARNKDDVEAHLKAKVEAKRAKELEEKKAELHNFIKENSCK